jgi:hypothetical protein
MDQNNNEKIQYLQMIQANISRLSNISFGIKGFMVTFVPFILSYQRLDQEVRFCLMCFLIPLTLTDIYYLRLEKRFRVLYNNVIKNKHVVDFRLEPPRKHELTKDEDSIINCLKSPSIYLFYTPFFIILAIIYFLLSDCL